MNNIKNKKEMKQNTQKILKYMRLVLLTFNKLENLSEISKFLLNV